MSNPPGSTPSHRADLEPGIPAREVGALPRRLKPLASVARAPLFEVSRVRFTHRPYWHTHLLHMHFLHVSCSELKKTTRKTSQVWDYFELEGNGKVVCELCKVRLAYNNSTGAMRSHTGTYALAWRLAKARKCQSCHTLQHVAAVRDPIRAVYSSKRRPTSVVMRDFQNHLESCLSPDHVNINSLNKCAWSE